MNIQHSQFMHKLSDKTFNKKIDWVPLDSLPKQISDNFSVINSLDSYSCTIDSGNIYLIHGVSSITPLLNYRFHIFLNSDDQFLELNVPEADIYQLQNAIHSYITSKNALFDSFNSEIDNK